MAVPKIVEGGIVPTSIEFPSKAVGQKRVLINADVIYEGGVHGTLRFAVTDVRDVAKLLRPVGELIYEAGFSPG